MISSTSGSTKPSRKIEFTHKEVYEMSRRNIDIFKFKPETSISYQEYAPCICNDMYFITFNYGIGIS